MAQTKLSAGLKNIVPVGTSDIHQNDSVKNRQHYGGAYAFMLDGYGPRLFRYGQNRSGSNTAQGDLATRYGTTAGTAVNDVTSGTTTSFGKANGWVSGIHEGQIALIDDGGASAGVKPEGETSIVLSNTTATVNVDPNLPYSTAILTGDDVTLLGGWGTQDAADNDLCFDVYGVVMPTDGLDDFQFGWYQSWGMTPGATVGTAAVTVNTALAAGAAILVDATAGDNMQKFIGYAPMAIAADLVSPFKHLVFMTLDFGNIPFGLSGTS
jgi:hypothetical protein